MRGYDGECEGDVGGSRTGKWRTRREFTTGKLGEGVLQDREEKAYGRGKRWFTTGKRERMSGEVRKRVG